MAEKPLNSLFVLYFEEKVQMFDITRFSYNISLPVLKFLGVNAVGVPDGPVPLDDTDASCSGSAQVPHCVQTHIAETLNDEGLTGPARCNTDHGHILSLVDEVVETVKDSSSGGRGTSGN